jgi:hypothetical protein
MPSTEVQRTLVKSPPELWAELSDPESLSRHLGELGEIRVTRVEPESAVEWEAENIRGSVQLKPSGWGTKVTFSVTRELPESGAQEPAREMPEPEIVEPEQVSPEPAEPELAEPEPAEPEPAAPELAEPDPAEPEPAKAGVTEQPMPTPRLGFFARLFRRRRRETPAPEPEVVEPEALEPEIVEPEAVAPETVSATESLAEAGPVTEQATPVHEHAAENTESTAEDSPDLVAELAAMEQAMAEQDAALLSTVLDRLGAAHHRPFSRG